MRNVLEKIVAGILTCSGFVTSLTIVLIVLFLFSEALGLFGSKVIEEGYVLALNKENVVDELSPREIKDIFDEEITNWKEVGGEDRPIKLFRLEDVTTYFTDEQLGAAYENAGACITSLVERTPGIIAFVPGQFIVQPDSVHLVKDNTISVKDVFAGAEWFPTATPAPQFGFLPLVTGTLWVSFFAILIALPFGLAVAIYMSEVANHRVRNMLKPVIELLSGIPSVVYGFFGLIVIVPFLQEAFNLPVGESGLAGAPVLARPGLPPRLRLRGPPGRLLPDLRRFYFCLLCFRFSGFRLFCFFHGNNRRNCCRCLRRHHLQLLLIGLLIPVKAHIFQIIHHIIPGSLQLVILIRGHMYQKDQDP